MELNPVAVAWIAIVNKHGRSEICEVVRGVNTQARYIPVLLRMTEQGEIIIEIQNKPVSIQVSDEDRFDDRKNVIVWIHIDNGILTRQDAHGKPILHIVPCRTKAEAIAVIKKLVDARQPLVLAA